MYTEKLLPMLLASLAILAWKSISIQHHSVEMASYNAPKNTLKEYKCFEKRNGAKEGEGDINIDEIFGNKFYL